MPFLIVPKFDELIIQVGDHHIFTGPNKNGYGRVYVGTYEGCKKYRMPAHIYALKRLGIEIPEGRIICHHCDVPPCVNPFHLYVGDKSTNQLDFHKRLATPEYYRRVAEGIQIAWDNPDTYYQRCENMRQGALRRWSS